GATPQQWHEERSAQTQPNAHARSIGCFALFGAEFLGPGHNRAPDEAVHQKNHQHHRHDSQNLSAHIAAFDGYAHIRAESRETKVLLSQNESLADSEKKPAAGHR